MAAVFALAAANSATAQPESEELEAVREQIRQVESRMESELSAMDSDRQALRRIETQIAEQHGVLDAVRRDRAAEQARLEDLNTQTAAARVELGGERDALARQVLLSYMTGREELLKLVLNQESPTELGRVVTWYDFFNDYRSQRIESVRAELEQLANLLRETRAAEQRLAELTGAAEAELAALEAARSQRNSIIAERESGLLESDGALDTLRADEQQLTDLLVELGDVLAAFPAGSQEPFAQLRGRLAWPTPGRIDSDFGAPRNGGTLRWDGVVLAAEPGSVVRAIYHGRVAYADWVPNFGLTMILDHGDGFLSVYGHNEVLFRESGEWVVPGEEVAQIGSEGGRRGLFFGLRHHGDPIDPKDWMRSD